MKVGAGVRRDEDGVGDDSSPRNLRRNLKLALGGLKDDLWDGENHL